MKNGLVIADAGPIFSLAIIDKLHLLDQLFDEIRVPLAVWNEISANKHTKFYQTIIAFFKDKVVEIASLNELVFVMDYGESEAVILYKELNAHFLLIDDKKARKIAETLDITCVGTLGVLSIAKDKKLIGNLRPLFITFLENDRYYSLNLLNTLLKQHDEPII